MPRTFSESARPSCGSSRTRHGAPPASRRPQNPAAHVERWLAVNDRNSTSRSPIAQAANESAAPREVNEVIRLSSIGTRSRGAFTDLSEADLPVSALPTTPPTCYRRDLRRARVPGTSHRMGRRWLRALCSVRLAGRLSGARAINSWRVTGRLRSATRSAANRRSWRRVRDDKKPCTPGTTITALWSTPAGALRTRKPQDGRSLGFKLALGVLRFALHSLSRLAGFRDSARLYCLPDAPRSSGKSQLALSRTQSLRGAAFGIESLITGQPDESTRPPSGFLGPLLDPLHSAWILLRPPH